MREAILWTISALVMSFAACESNREPTTGCTSNSECPDGQECEIEHDEGFCKPHGGDALQSALIDEDGGM